MPLHNFRLVYVSNGLGFGCFFFHSFWDHSVIHNSMNDEATNQTCILLNFFKLLRDDMNIKMLYIMCSFWLLEHDFGMQTNFLILKLQSNFFGYIRLSAYI